MITVIDMNMGNLQSVLEAFRCVGTQVMVTTQGVDIERSSAIVLPGVGAFGDGMANLRERGLVEPLRHLVLERKKPLLGICLGMQLLAEEGEEHGVHKGLGLIRGHVVKLKPTEKTCRIPNMGWCDITVVNRQSALFAQVQDGESFYFAHSYYMRCSHPQDVAATIEYGEPITAAIERGNIFGIQFHPEKSQEAGLDLLSSFFNFVVKNSVRQERR